MLVSRPRLRAVKCVAALLLAICFLGIGSGGLEYIHDHIHEMEDARQDAEDRAAGRPVEHHEHDENNCDVHAQLHMPLLAGGWVLVLVWLGLFATFALIRDESVVPFLQPHRIDCRGPPAR